MLLGHIPEAFGRGAETWEPVSLSVETGLSLDAVSEAPSGHEAGGDRPEHERMAKPSLADRRPRSRTGMGPMVLRFITGHVPFFTCSQSAGPERQSTSTLPRFSDMITQLGLGRRKVELLCHRLGDLGV